VNLFFRLLALRLRSKRWPRVGLWDAVTISFRVNPADLDVLRHMNNGRYLSLLDLGRLDVLTRSGFAAVVKQHGWYPVVSAQSITYRKSLTVGQRFQLTTRFIGIDDRASYAEQVVHRDGVVYAHAVVQARFLRRSGGVVPQAELVEAAGGAPVLALPDAVRAWAEAARSLASRHAVTVDIVPGEE
jgi:acyl-CoA thioesterase FadM